MKSRTFGLVSISAVLAAIVVTATAAAVAQAPRPAAAPPQRILVTWAQLRPEMMSAWEDLQKKEMIPAQKKAGVPWRHTFMNGATGQGYTRVTVTPLGAYADFDKANAITQAAGADAFASYNARVRQMTVTYTASVETFRPDLSLQSNASPMPPLAIVQTVVVLPGKGNAVAASIVEDYLPAFRKAGVKDFRVYVTNQGGPGGRFTLVRPIASYSELDQPGLLQRAALTQANIDRINARRDALLATGIETEVQRFLPDLSYGMPAPARPTN